MSNKFYPNAHRIIHRHFSRFKVVGGGGNPDPARDEWKEISNDLIEYHVVKLTSFEVQWGQEDKSVRRIRVLPANFAVNVVKITTEFKPDGYVHFFSAEIEYFWGLPLPSIAVHRFYYIGDSIEDEHFEYVKRADADESSMILPPGAPVFI
jgi:hypothetical protein